MKKSYKDYNWTSIGPEGCDDHCIESPCGYCIAPELKNKGNIMKPVYIIFGVPGSGKTWCMNQLKDKFTTVAHDDYIGDESRFIPTVLSAARNGDRPVLVDSPFKVNSLIKMLTDCGCTVKPYFILETPTIVRHRYETRENKPIPKQHITRIVGLVKKAQDLNAPRGTATQVLDMLKKVLVIL